MKRFLIVYLVLAAGLLGAAPVVLSTAHGSAQPGKSADPRPAETPRPPPIMECDGGGCSPLFIRRISVYDPLIQRYDHAAVPGETANLYRYFYYETSTPYWSVMAIKPRPRPSTTFREADYDLHLYRDKSWRPEAVTGRSRWPSNLMDFVAVDSNSGRMPYGKHYAWTQLYTGYDDGFTIQLAAGSHTLPRGTGPQDVVMRETDIVTVRDAYLTAGQAYTIALDTPDAVQTGLFVMGSRSGEPGTFVQSIDENVAGAYGRSDPQLRIVAPTTGWYGVVVLNIAGSGTYKLSLS